MSKIQLSRTAVAIPPLVPARFDEVRAICGSHVTINGPYGDGHLEVVWTNQPAEFLEQLRNHYIPALEKYFEQV